MPELLSGNAVIGQSGGPTAVINQSLAGVVEGLRLGLAASGKVGRIFGMRHGVRGLVKPGAEGLLDLTQIDKAKLEAVARTPSAALGSTRDKPDEAYCEKILEGCRRNDIRYFFYIGGNDSADTCRIVSEKAAAAGYELRCFHVPKTIDNDLLENDHTPGFPSAARYVSLALMGDALDNASLGGIKINVIMGRNAGFPRRRLGDRAGRRARRRRAAGPARAASDLSARGAVLDRRLPRRCRGGLRQARALPDRRQRRHPRRVRRGDRTKADAGPRRGRRARQCAALGLGRARRWACRSGQDGAYAERRQEPQSARRHVRLYPALLAACLAGRYRRSARGRTLRGGACGTRRCLRPR